MANSAIFDVVNDPSVFPVFFFFATALFVGNVLYN